MSMSKIEGPYTQQVKETRELVCLGQFRPPSALSAVTPTASVLMAPPSSPVPPQTPHVLMTPPPSLVPPQTPQVNTWRDKHLL